jgi:mRNA interferase MazF
VGSKPAGRRPVLLLSRDDFYTSLNEYIAAEITTTILNIPIEVPLGARDGLPKPCVVSCDILKRALGYTLGWEELIGG